MPIFVLSDSIGETGELLVKAATVQFDKSKFDIKRIPNLRSVAAIEEALALASEAKAMVVYTLVNNELLDYLRKRVTELELISVDIMHPILSCLHSFTGEEPSGQAGLNRKVDKNYFSKVEAIEFAVKFDDGKDPRGLLKADIVVIGVSRTSKTPLCMYLAYQGIKAANVPLVIETPPPEELFKVPAKKVIGLSIKPEKLQEIRKQRLKIMGLPSTAGYANMDKLLVEYEYSRLIMRKIGCPIVDITNKAVEETATNIIKICQNRKE